MTDPRSEFLATILAAPEDDTCRKVFADWLEENGEEERAEFIRVQCELAISKSPHLPPVNLSVVNSCSPAIPCRYCYLRRREQELRLNHQEKWLGVFWDLMHWRNRSIERIEWHRGFIEHITCSWADWLAHHAAIRAVAPVREVTLTTIPALERIVAGSEIFFLRDRPNGVTVDRCHDKSGGEILGILLMRTWPGITFHFPPPYCWHDAMSR